MSTSSKLSSTEDRRSRLLVFRRRLGHPDDQYDVGYDAECREGRRYNERHAYERWRDAEVFGQPARYAKYPLAPALNEASSHRDLSRELGARRAVGLAVENGHPFRRKYSYEGYYPRTF